jgi:hypothetical protein
MRAFAKQTITTAAVAAGLAETAVMDKPDKETILLPEKRIQLEYMPETLARRFRRIKRSTSIDNPETHRTLRSRLYETVLAVRVDIRGDNEAWLAAFFKDLLLQLPRKVANDDGDLVKIEAFKAERGGFGTRMVEAFVKRSVALHVNFTGMVCADEEVPLITDVNLVDGVSTGPDNDDGDE